MFVSRIVTFFCYLCEIDRLATGVNVLLLLKGVNHWSRTGSSRWRIRRLECKKLLNAWSVITIPTFCSRDLLGIVVVVVGDVEFVKALHSDYMEAEELCPGEEDFFPYRSCLGVFNITLNVNRYR